MNKLSAFLHPVKTSIEKEVVISNRFLDENGTPVPFKVRAISQEENDELIKKATKTEIKNGQKIESLDNVDFARRLIVAATVEPDFSAKEMCDTYGVVSPYLVPGKMLLAGEYNRLMEAISSLSEIDQSSEEEALKN